MGNKIILGTVQFGINYGINNTSGKITKDNIFKILNYCEQNNILYLDTAASYGDSEQVIGNYLNLNPNVNFKIISKLNLYNQTFDESLEKSLNRLNIKYLDTILFHSYEDYLKHKLSLPEFKYKYQGKLFNKIGVSVYTNVEVEGVINDSNIDVVQAPFNILDNASKREETYKKIKKAGKILHTRSVFLQGLIFKNSNNLQGEFSSLKTPLKSIEKLCKLYKLSINELALSYVLSKSYIDGVLIGIDNLNQLINNMEIAHYKIPDNLFNEIDNLVVQDINILNPKNWLKNSK
jgi:aryl-alcohol dehydrogenase-like predicted oxidoreductase